jgi:hypothetical protein
MSYHLGQVSMPVSQVRLASAVITAVSFGFLIYLASVNFDWLTMNRGFLMLTGMVIGLLLGWIEARTVTRGLTENQQIIVWQVLLASVVLIGSPLLLAKLLLDNSDFLPFASYLFLPAVPVFSFFSGWLFRKFESKNNVQVKILSFGYIYYKEPIIVDSNRFSEFMRQVASRDSSSLWQQIGYTKRLMAALERRQDLESSTRENLLNIVRFMDRYRRMAIASLSIFLVAVSSMLIIISTDMLGLIRMSKINVGDIIGVGSGIVFFGFVTMVFFLVMNFKRKISNMLT